VDIEVAAGDALRTPTQVDNTANLAAIGELNAGALQGVQDAIHVKMSYGVGAGLIIDGSLYRGSAGTAGEIGHVTIDDRGAVCRCGNRGCLDTVVGSAAILDALRPTHGGVTLKDVISRALAGDTACQRVLGDAGDALGSALSAVVNLLNPQMISVGGQMARVGELLLGPARRTIERCALPSAGQSVTIVPGVLGDEADVIGALHLAHEMRETAQRAGLALA